MKAMRRVSSLLLSLVLAVFVLIAPAFAVLPDEVLPDRGLEGRARALSQELRCMVCQNQSIDDSEAPLARDLRILVRDRLKAGDNDQQVLDFLTARYGDFVLLRPRFDWHTALLWLTPLLLLIAGGVRLAWMARRSRAAGASAQNTEAATLSPAEEARVAEILRQQG
jgi:cytochrome c-type biogenesis protein CcmH